MRGTTTDVFRGLWWHGFIVSASQIHRGSRLRPLARWLGIFVAIGVVAACSPTQAWSRAEVIAQPADSEFRVASDGQTVVTAWQWREETFTAASQDGGASWGPPVKVSRAGDVNVGEPKLIVVGSTAVLAWAWNGSALTGSSGGLRMVSSSDGGKTWGPPSDIHKGPVLEDEWALAGSADEITVLWAAPQQSSSGASVRASCSRTLGKEWTPPVQVASYDRGVRGIAIAASAPTVAGAWITDVAHTSTRTNTDCGWSDPNTIQTEGDRPPITLKIAAEQNRVVAVWAERSIDKTRIRAQASGDGGQSWGGPEFLSRTLADAGHPSISMNGDTAVVTWMAKKQSPGVQVAVSRDGGARWSEPTNVSSAVGELPGGLIGVVPRPAVSDEAVLISWWNDSGEPTVKDTVQAVTSADGGLSWSEPNSLATDVRTPNPHVAITDDFGLVIWADQNSYGGGLLAKRNPAVSSNR